MCNLVPSPLRLQIKTRCPRLQLRLLHHKLAPCAPRLPVMHLRRRFPTGHAVPGRRTRQTRAVSRRISCARWVARETQLQSPPWSQASGLAASLPLANLLMVLRPSVDLFPPSHRLANRLSANRPRFSHLPSCSPPRCVRHRRLTPRMGQRGRGRSLCLRW